MSEEREKELAAAAEREEVAAIAAVGVEVDLRRREEEEEEEEKGFGERLGRWGRRSVWRRDGREWEAAMGERESMKTGREVWGVVRDKVWVEVERAQISPSKRAFDWLVEGEVRSLPLSNI